MIRRRISAVWHAVRRAFRARREGLRSLLVVVLILGLIVQSVLLWARVVLTDGMSLGGVVRTQISALTQRVQKTDNSAGAMPIRFAARGDDGLYGMQYNADGMQQAYEATVDAWAQAWNQADSLMPSNAGEYRKALRRHMVMMEYDGSIPLNIVMGWLDCTPAEGMEEQTVGTMALCQGEDGTYTLYLRDSKTGAILCANTTVDDTVFDTAVGQFEPNGCQLTADTDDTMVSSDVLYFSSSEVFDVLSFNAYNGVDGWGDILTAFGMDASAAMASAYESNDVMVYVSGRNTVRLAQDGSMRYDGSGIRVPLSQGNDKLLQCVQIGYELSNAALEALDCGGTAALVRAHTDADGRYVVVFGTQIGGVPVDNLVTGYFARYEFTSDAMVHANLALRTCQATGDTVAVMPGKQAAASLNSSVDTALSLRYLDKAVGTNSSWEQLYDEDNDTGADNGSPLSDAADEQQDEEADSAWNDVLESNDEPEQEEDTGVLDDPWDAENDDVPEREDESGEAWNTAWYDSTGTPVSPQWYALRYDGSASLPHTGRTLSPQDIVVVRADFDRLIQGGGAS